MAFGINPLAQIKPYTPPVPILQRSGQFDGRTMSSGYQEIDPKTGLPFGAGANHATAVQGGSAGARMSQVAVNGKQTGIVDQGTIDPNTGFVTGGVLATPRSEHDAAVAYENAVPWQAPAVMNNPTVQGAVQSIGSTLAAGPNPYGNDQIAAGGANIGQSRDDARFAAKRVQSAGGALGSAQKAQIAAGSHLGEGAAAGQTELGKILAGGAAGNGPTAASSLFGHATDQNIAAMRAASAGVHGQGAVAASRNAGAQGSQLGMEAQSQAAALRAQEQQAAQNLYSQHLATQRAGDVGTFNALTGATTGARGQDIAGATAASQAAQGVTANDISAAGTMGGLQNTLSGLNADVVSKAQAAGINVGQLVQAAQAGDQNAMLSLAQLVQNAAIQNRQLSLGKTATKLGVVGAVTNAVGGVGAQAIGGQ